MKTGTGVFFTEYNLQFLLQNDESASCRKDDKCGKAFHQLQAICSYYETFLK